MVKRIWIIIGLIWVLLTVGVGIYLAQDCLPGKDYTIYNHSCRGGADTYVSENRKEDALLYKIGENRGVRAMFTTAGIDHTSKIAGIAYKDNLYVLLQGSIQESGKMRTIYRIYQLSSSLKPTAASGYLTLDAEGVLSGFDVSEDSFYLTLISADGSQADGYRSDRTVLTDISSDKEEEEPGMDVYLLRSEQTWGSEDGHFIVDADWNAAGVQLRTDQGMEEGDWQTMMETKSAYEGRKLSPLQILSLARIPLIVCAVMLVVGLTILFILSRLLKNRNRIVYMAILMESVLLAITLIGAGLINEKRKEMQVQEYSNFGFFVMEDLLKGFNSLERFTFDEPDFYEQEDYYTLQNALAETVVRSGSTQVFYDLCVVRVKDQMIVASASGRNGYRVGSVYTDAAGKIVSELKITEQEIVSETEIDGQEYGLLVLGDSKGPVPSYALLGVTRQEILTGESVQDMKEIAWLFGIFVVGSIFCFFILWIQSEDLRRVCSAMQAVATGREDVELEKTSVLGSDMKSLWNSVYEVNKTVKNVYYTKYLMFEAYYRFAPKRIEKILNKDSITEVKSGDAIRLNGTIAMISTKQKKRIALQKNQNDGRVDLEDMNRLLALIAHYQEEEQGILVSNDGTLSAMKMLFRNGGSSTVNFGIEFGHMLEEAKEEGGLEAAVLLHRTDVLYGIAGVKEQSMPFLISEEIKELEQYAEWFREMGIRLVATGSVDRGGCASRYIGYFEIAACDEKIDLYEILDVCPEKERRSKLSYDETFQKAIRLFYQNDFYLARSAFTEIVKESAEDRIAKWYLFTCEKYLNEAHTDAISCKLNQ